LPYRPCWVTGEFLRGATVENGMLKIGSMAFPFLHVECRYLDYDSLKEITRLAKSGLRVVMVDEPEEPGFVLHERYDSLLGELLGLQNVSQSLDFPKALESQAPLEYWIREDDGAYKIFIAHPSSRAIGYPMALNQSDGAKPATIPATIRLGGQSYRLDLEFGQNRPLVLSVKDKQVKMEGI
jgi:hypothetical protein